MQRTDRSSRRAAAFAQLLSDMVLWVALVLLFFGFRLVLFWLFHREVAQRPSWDAFLRCFETGMRSDTCAATWGLLPTFALTLVGFIHPLGIWHRRIRQLTTVIALSLCAIIFVTDVGYFAEYDNQFDHWIFGLIYDDRAAILTTVWKSYHIVLLISLAALGVAIGAWSLNKLCRIAESAELPTFLGTKSGRAITLVVVAVWLFVGTKIWLGRNLAGLKNAASTGNVFLNKIVLNPFFALRYAIWQEHSMQKSAGLRTILPNGDVHSAAVALYPRAQDATNLDDCLKRVAPGNAGARPTHISLW